MILLENVLGTELHFQRLRPLLGQVGILSRGYPLGAVRTALLWLSVVESVLMLGCGLHVVDFPGASSVVVEGRRPSELVRVVDLLWR